MQNLASKILCIFVTGSAYAPYAPCLSTPLDKHDFHFIVTDNSRRIQLLN